MYGQSAHTPIFGGDLDSTGVLKSKLHARDAVGPLKNGTNHNRQ